jgi:hypothetical protein
VNINRVDASVELRLDLVFQRDEQMPAIYFAPTLCHTYPILGLTQPWEKAVRTKQEHNSRRTETH